MTQINKVKALLILAFGISCIAVGARTNTKQLNLQLVDIPRGTFKMGSPVWEYRRDPDETQFNVRISAFRMTKYEITNEQYAVFLNDKKISDDGIYAAGSYPKDELIYASSGKFDWGLHFTEGKWVPVEGFEKNPVINVSWYGAMEFAAYVGGTVPTEAQWEYACRAGTKTPFNTGNFMGNREANYDWTHPYNSDVNMELKSPGRTLPVGSFPANAFGLCDIHGNVWEWTKDFHARYPTDDQVNYSGPEEVNVMPGRELLHTMRGGCWNNYAFYCRSASRRINTADYKANVLGFRVVFNAK